MRLRHLHLANFRNHKVTDVALGFGPVVLVGANAQGKSAVLEAIYVSATGRSFRTAHEVEMVALGAEWARLRSTVQRADREEEIEVTLRRDAGLESRAVREIRVNGVAVRRGDLFGHLCCVTAAPEDAEVVAGSPRLRRRLLDLLLAQISPAYYHNAQRYHRVLLQRNRLLRRGGVRELDPWDEQLATIGAAITLRRRGVAARLAEHAAPIFAALSGGREMLRLEYVPSLAGEDAAEIEAAARDALIIRREWETARGVTTVGPHRDDLRLRLDGHDLRAYGSRGQHLSTMLAVRLAERRVLREEIGEDPVLLLDDVLLTLDEERQAYLLDAIHGCQAFLTVTTLASVRRLPEDAGVFRVDAGTVTRIHAHLT
jgi:DNA replication and repair protein RecF